LHSAIGDEEVPQRDPKDWGGLHGDRCSTHLLAAKKNAYKETEIIVKERGGEADDGLAGKRGEP